MDNPPKDVLTELPNAHIALIQKGVHTDQLVDDKDTDKDDELIKSANRALFNKYQVNYVETSKKYYFVCATYQIQSDEESSNDANVFVFDKNWHKVAIIQGIPQQAGKGNEILLYAGTGERLPFIVVLAGEGPSQTAYVGTINLKKWEFNNIFTTKNVDNVNALWAGGEFILYYSNIKDQLNKIIGINAASLKPRVIYTEIKGMAGHKPFQRAFLSPNGRYIAFDRLPPYPTEGCAIWVLDLKVGRMSRVTSETQIPYYHVIKKWVRNDSLDFFVKKKDVWDLYQLTYVSLDKPNK